MLDSSYIIVVLFALLLPSRLFRGGKTNLDESSLALCSNYAEARFTFNLATSGYALSSLFITCDISTSPEISLGKNGPLVCANFS